MMTISKASHPEGRRRLSGLALAAVAALTICLAAPIGARAESADAALLAEVDSYRSFDERGFSFDFATDGSEGSSLMRVSVQATKGENALVRYLAPAKDKGKLVLVRGESFWILDLGMKKPLRISPRQLLFGQASAGDITRISYGTMYDIKGRTSAQGGFILNLAAKKGAGATYDLVDLRIDSSGRPIDAACKGRSGALIKTITYEKFENIEGKELLTAFSILDAVSGEIERVRISNFDRSLPPDSAFTVPGLRFQK